MSQSDQSTFFLKVVGVVAGSCFLFSLGVYFHFRPDLILSIAFGRGHAGPERICDAREFLSEETDFLLKIVFYFAACVFFVTFVVHCIPVFQRSELSVQKKYVSLIGSTISIFTLVTYIFILAHSNDICASNGLPVDSIRYALWIVSTPMLIFLISLLGGKETPWILFTGMSADALMIILGYLSRLYFDHFWWYYNLSCVCYFVVMASMYRLFEYARCQSILANDQKMIVLLRNATFLVWLIFPVAEICRSLKLVDTLVSETLFTIADLSAKCAYSYVLVRGNFFVIDELAAARGILDEEVLTDAQKSFDTMQLTARILELAKDDQSHGENLHRSFLAKMSHELRTPLNSVIGFNELLLDAVEPEKKALVHNSLLSARTLLRVIDQVMLHSSMQAVGSGIHATDLSKFIVSDLVDEVVEILSPKARDHNCCILVDIDPRTLQASIRSDVYHLRIILLNVLDNAIQFSRKTSGSFALLRVMIQDQGESAILQIEIRDNGPGMSHDIVEFLKSRPVHCGTFSSGLGLVQSSLQLLNGRSNANSNTNGTIVMLSIPVHLSEFPPALPQLARTSSHADVVVLTSMQGLSQILHHQIKFGGFENVSSFSTEESAWEVGFDRVVSESFERVLILLVDQVTLERCLFQTSFQIALGRPYLKLFVLSDNERAVTSFCRQQLPSANVSWYPRSMKPSLLSEVVEAIPKEVKKAIRAKKKFSSSDDESLSVLLVEDNEMNVKVASLMLQKLKVNHDVAYNGMEAVEALMNGKPYHFILMDLNMPVMDGVEATKKIRELERSKKLPRRNTIVALTAVNLEDVKGMCSEVGMDGFMTKPLSMRDLRRAIRKFR